MMNKNVLLIISCLITTYPTTTYATDSTSTPCSTGGGGGNTDFKPSEPSNPNPSYPGDRDLSGDWRHSFPTSTSGSTQSSIGGSNQSDETCIIQ